ncbi:PRC-barrel domain-containing protein [Streptomyces sp. NPDC005263]|uniref:PRC-barrel domain-containing protein n=1 Tax=Streptomyces sp. NPDC005263 TaxID=3364711 RepID=UPI0036A2851F
MIRSADIREWRNHDVVDPRGRKIGMLEAVYVDTATDQPAVATVRTGLPTRQRLIFVPLDEAVLGPDYVRVSYAKTAVRKAPSIGTDDVLPAGREKSIFQYYGMAYEPGVNGERRLARR